MHSPAGGFAGPRRLVGPAAAGIGRDAEFTYSFPNQLGENVIAYDGRWKIEGERAIAGRGAGLRLPYRARNVYLANFGLPLGSGTTIVRLPYNHAGTRLPR
mgnify:CR=1 FL=1